MEDAYDRVPYLGTVLPWTSPAHLALCASWHGRERPPLERFRFVELGCGDGGNLLPLAYYHPDATFIGVDSSRAALARARQGAEAVGVSNVRFIERDVRRLAEKDLGPCDYVVAHGLYSWVPDEARSAILRFCGDHLTPAGLVYISYNAQPGWATRRVVRETLLRAPSVREAEAPDKALRAVEEARRLLEDLPSREYAWAVLLAEELERVRDGQPFYVFHEYLAEHNEGFWLRDFAERAQGFDLEYVADAQFCRWEGRVPPELPVAGRCDQHPLAREETADLLGHRWFRSSVLGRAGAGGTVRPRPQILQEAHLATSLGAESDPFDLSDGVAERFGSHSGPAAVTVRSAITKAAVVTLAAGWPAGLRFDLLFDKAIALLARHGCQGPVDLRSRLADELTTLFEAGQLDLRLREPPMPGPASDPPCLGAVARHELQHRKALSTPHHLPLELEADMHAVACALDGSCSRGQLHQIFGEQIAARTLTALGRWGLLTS